MAFSTSPSFLQISGDFFHLTSAATGIPTNHRFHRYFSFPFDKKKRSIGNLCFSEVGLPSRTLLRSTLASSMSTADKGEDSLPMKLLFVEMGVGYDQHGQDITATAVRACRDAISSNSIPAFRRGSIPGINSDQMKLVVKLGVPRPTQHLLDIERVKAVFPYGQIISVDVVDGGMICSSGVYLEAMGDKNDDCYIVNAAVYVGY